MAASQEKITPYKGTEPYIFISYAHKNDKEVRKIISRLQDNGFRVWFDEGIDPGTEWAEHIAERVSSCGYFIAFVSDEYLESTNCRDELSFARDKNKKRLLVYLSDVQLSDGMSMRLNRIQAIFKYTYKNENDFYEKLFNASDINTCHEDEPKEMGSDISETAEEIKTLNCRKCGAVLDADAKFCKNCGAVCGQSNEKTLRPPWVIPAFSAAVVFVIILIAVIAGSANDDSSIAADVPVTIAESTSEATDAEITDTIPETMTTVTTTTAKTTTQAVTTTKSKELPIVSDPTIDGYLDMKGLEWGMDISEAEKVLPEGTLYETENGEKYLYWTNIDYNDLQNDSVINMKAVFRTSTNKLYSIRYDMLYPKEFWWEKNIFQDAESTFLKYLGKITDIKGGALIGK